VLPFLTRKGLEQATPQRVAEVRADRIRRRTGAALLWDATCGVGSDAVAGSRAGHQVLASDRDGEVLDCAAANLERAGGAATCLRADAHRLPAARSRLGELLVLLDPDRRPEGKRAGDPGTWSPSLERTLEIAAAFRGGCVKLPPAFDPALLPPPREGQHALTWISLGGELRELALWTGDLAPPDGVGREALALDRGGGATRVCGTPVEVDPLPPGEERGITWLAEPDPAVIRAGLVGRLARDAGLSPLAPGIAYLGGDERPSSPLLRAWRVLETAPLDRRRVRVMLAQHDVGPLVVKKRGHPDSARTLAARLAGRGERRGLLAVTRLRRGHLALLLEEGDGTNHPTRG